MDTRSNPVGKLKASPNHYPSLFSALLFTLGALFLFGIGLLMGVGALASLLMGTQIPSQQTVLLVAFSFEAIVLVIAAFFSFQKYLRKASADESARVSFSNAQIAVLVLIAGAALLIGYLIGQIKTIDWIFLPILTIPAIVFPLGVLLAFGTRKLPFGTRWQTWSVLGLSMTLAPLLLFMLEIFVVIVVFAIIVGYVLTQPELTQQLQGISEQIMVLGPQSEASLKLLSPFLTKPSVIALALIYVAVIIPAIEEIFKPIGVWLFASKLDSPAQGFTLGALSGAGYALIETIGVSGQTAEWASLLFSRIGTGLLHITTSALMGAAIVLAWRKRRYLRLLGTYLLAILLHGLWNALAIFFTFSTLAEFLDQAGWLRTIQPAMVLAMTILAIGLFAILLLSNRRMRNNVSVSADLAVTSENKEVNEDI